MLNDEIKKNGKMIEACTSELIRSSHKGGHNSLEKSEIFNIDFRVTMKDAVSRQPDKSVAQVYQEEQSKVVSQMGSLELLLYWDVASNLNTALIMI